jgi:heat-inducible transcriptional repressor
MAELSEMGFLFQPHASAGRIPTSKAYRLYVDAILRRRRIPPEGLNPYLSELKDRRRDVEKALAFASQLLGRLTKSIGVAAFEVLDEVLFQRVDMSLMDSRHALALIVLEGGMVHHKVIDFPEEVTQTELDEICRRVNLVAAGRPWSEVRLELTSYLVAELDRHAESCRVALRAIDDMRESESMRIYTGGAQHILGLPDFQDLGKLQALLSLLEEESVLGRMVQDSSLQDGVSVTIGEENGLTQMQDLSVVLASDVSKGHRMVVGLIGPQRMDYARAISILEGVLPQLTGGIFDGD